jgi:hypothetical protein
MQHFLFELGLSQTVRYIYIYIYLVIKKIRFFLVRSVNFALSSYHLCAFVRSKPIYARNSVRFNPVLTLFYKEILASKVLQRESTICGQLGCPFFSRQVYNLSTALSGRGVTCREQSPRTSPRWPGQQSRRTPSRC